MWEYFTYKTIFQGILAYLCLFVLPVSGGILIDSTQDCQSKTEELCATIDIDESSRHLLKTYSLQWDMGDGQFENGTVVTHCYHSAGHFKAVLHLIHKKTGKVIENELVVDLIIAPANPLEIKVPEEAFIYQEINFERGLELPERYSELNTEWSFGDGSFSQETQPDYLYQLPGTYQIDLSVTAASASDTLTFCQSKTLVISGFNVDGEDVLKSLQEVRQGPSFNRFLKDSLHLVLADLKDSSNVNKPTLGSGRYTLPILTDTRYGLWAWSGNSFSRYYEFSTEGLSGEQANQTFKEQLHKLSEETWYTFHPITFDIDQVKSRSEDERKLQENLQLLLDNPHLLISIGSYTHSEGRSLDLSFRLSAQRSAHMRDFFISNGVDANQINTVTPQQAPSLINMEIYGSLPYAADKALNTRSDVKIDHLSY